MTRTLQTCLTLCTLLVFTSAVMAQGTATSPSTEHIADSAGSVVHAGGPLDTVNGPGPYPIDLDPTGGPWRKTINSDLVAGYIGTGNMTMIETVQNVGTESWFDWHEILLNNGQLGVAWDSVISLTVNGSPITFNETIIGNDLTVDGFSQPVLPGDVFVIEKTLITTSNVVGPGQTLFQVLEYPTPEPASAALLGLGSVALLGKRRLGQRNQ